MSWFYRTLCRPVLFSQDSEAIHNRTLKMLGWASRQSMVCELLSSAFGSDPLPVQAFGLTFPNPVGLAAGMDKHAAAAPIWPEIGFGFSELGGVTAHAQPGNPEPRMFRAIADEALINRMGFNNPGAEAMALKLQEWRSSNRWPTHPVGINLGKSKLTSLEKAPEDYAISFRLLRPYADFFVVNVSSPNTPSLRRLQDKTALDEILAALQMINQEAGAPARPILVKVAPDLTFDALDEILELVRPRNLAGIVATNTTITRPERTDPALQGVYLEAGGLSGKPLRQRSTEVIRHLYLQSKGTLPIIGVGGIFSAQDAWEKILAGSCLVQIYTGLVYEGPSLPKEIVKGLRSRLEKAGLKHLVEAVGVGDL